MGRKNDPVYTAARDLVSRFRDTEALQAIGYQHGLEPFVKALEAALPPKPISSRKLIDLLDDPRIASAVNERGGGRWS